MKSHYLLLLFAFLLGACSSGTKSEQRSTDVMSQKMKDRIASSRKRMDDPNDRSVFDKSMRSNVTNNKGGGSYFGRKSYKSNSYAGTKSYTNTGKFKTNDFSGSKSKSHMGKQSFAQGDKTSSAADDTFATSNSRFGKQESRDASKGFSGSDDVFKTSSQYDARKSQQKNDRPKFIEIHENARKVAYSEDQIRNMLGRSR